MNRLRVYSAIFLLCSHFAWSQQVRTIQNLPDELQENSGMIHLGGGLFYFLNDGGNDPLLYRIDTTLEGFGTFEIMNAANVDWEDMAVDDHRNVYIGDIGNNGNARQNLAIYKTVDPETVFSNQLYVDTIQFSYANQSAFPPAEPQLNFDCEAMCWFQDSLYLFTKNRTKPYNGWSYIYVLPDKPGKYVAQLRDSVQFSAATKEFGWVTSADIRGDTLVLLSSAEVHIVAGFRSAPLVELTRFSYSVGFSQKEAVSFGKSASQVFFSDEFRVIGNKLYMLSIEGNRLGVERITSPCFTSKLTSKKMEISCLKNKKALIRILDISGAEVYEGKVFGRYTIKGKSIPRGVYLVQVVIEGQYTEFRWVKSE